MINLNNVILVGRLTKDIDLRKTQSNISNCKFTLAVNRRFNNEEADFINCVAWKQSAEYLSNYAKKGTIVSVEGRIQTSSYEGKNGTVYATEVIADNVQIISEKKDNSRMGGYASDSGKSVNIDESELPFY